MDLTWTAFAQLHTLALSDQSLYDCISAPLFSFQVGHPNALHLCMLKSNLQGMWSDNAMLRGLQKMGCVSQYLLSFLVGI